MTTLIITDLDSVTSPPVLEKMDLLHPDTAPQEVVNPDVTVEVVIDIKTEEFTSEEEREDFIDEDEDVEENVIENTDVKPQKKYYGKACQPHIERSVTSNQTLIKWLPKIKDIKLLLNATEFQKTQLRTEQCPSLVYVTFQKEILVEWEGESKRIAGRTLEEAFALENFEWTQHPNQKALKLRVVTAKEIEFDKLCFKLFERVSGSSFNKTDFALGLMTKDATDWKVPSYINEGLNWLSKQINNISMHASETSELIGKIVEAIDSRKVDKKQYSLRLKLNSSGELDVSGYIEERLIWVNTQLNKVVLTVPMNEVGTISESDGETILDKVLAKTKDDKKQ